MIKRFSSISVLFIAQSIPLYFCTFALPTILRAEQVSLEKIGLLSMVLLPWVVKFLWAPIVDNYFFSALGKRRSWFLPLQIISTIILLLFAIVDYSNHWWLVFSMAFILSTVSATQSIANDGFTVEQFKQTEHRFVNFSRVFGITLGSLIGGALLISLYKTLGWHKTAYYITFVSFVVIIPIIFIREQSQIKIDNGERPSLKNFWQRSTTRHLLLLCLIYRACEGLVMGMQQPFLVDLKLPLSMIGSVMGIGNATLGLVGALAASYLLKPFGTKRSLLLLGSIRTICYLSLALIAAFHIHNPAVIFTVVLINMASRLMEMVVLYTIFMQYCSKKQAGTDFTVLVCAELLIYLSGMSASGFLAANIGYQALFTLGGLLSMPGLFGALYYLKRLKGEEGSQIQQEELSDLELLPTGK